jgi:hypothetical protein
LLIVTLSSKGPPAFNPESFIRTGPSTSDFIVTYITTGAINVPIISSHHLSFYLKCSRLILLQLGIEPHRIQGNPEFGRVAYCDIKKKFIMKKRTSHQNICGYLHCLQLPFGAAEEIHPKLAHCCSGQNFPLQLPTLHPIVIQTNELSWIFVCL